VLAEFQASIMLDKMRMFRFCSDCNKESSDQKIGNIILFIST